MDKCLAMANDGTRRPGGAAVLERR